MKIHNFEDEEQDLAKAIIDTFEKNTGEKVFTLRVMDEIEDRLNVIVVFENRDMVLGFITVDELVDKQLGIRIRANYI